MNTQIYEALKNTDISWYCCNCGLPNFNTSLFVDFVELSTPINGGNNDVRLCLFKHVPKALF
jgi:hypothetical protein